MKSYKVADLIYQVGSNFKYHLLSICLPMLAENPFQEIATGSYTANGVHNFYVACVFFIFWNKVLQALK